MAKIKKIKEGTATVYPATIPQAVIDPTSGKSVRTELNDFKERVNFLNPNLFEEGYYYNSAGNKVPFANCAVSGKQEILPSTKYILSCSVLPYEVMEYGSGGAFIKSTRIYAEKSFTTGSTTYFIGANWINTVTAGIFDLIKASAMLNYGGIAFPFIAYDNLQLKAELLIKYQPYVGVISTTHISVKPSGGDFTTVSAALKSITDASETNRYIIDVYSGTYNEIFIMPCNYTGNNPDVIQIIGQDKSNTFMVANGASTAISPADYYYPEYANTAYNLIPLAYKDQFALMRSMTIKNLYVQCIGCRYPFHMDYTYDAGAKEYVIENCILDYNSFAGIGIGLRPSQHIKIKDSNFVCSMPKTASTPKYGVYAHNLAGQAALGIDIENCQMDNCGIAYLDENGGSSQWYVNIKNCASNDELNGIYLTDNINISHTNRLVLTMSGNDYNLFTNDKGRLIKYDCKDEKVHRLVTNKSGAIITAGTLLVMDYSFTTDKYHGVIPSTSDLYDAVALEDMNVNATKYVYLTKKTFMANAEIGVYTIGQRCKVVGGIITSDVAGNIICLENKTLAAIGVLKVKKIY